tara:strand:+ start:190 stop:777 length:588 start_codon:yes stop_codon:yes gene_type:complete
MYFKLFQILADYLMIIIFFPIIIFLFLLISFFQVFFYGKNIFYFQDRLGQNKKKFKIIKFKTIILKNDVEISNFFSKFLRRSSLDEIPQIFNILKREMSFVGPRPYPLNIDLYHNSLKNINVDKRFETLPGITGLSQINYSGSERKLSEKILLDIEYVNKLSIKLYCKIVFKTFIVLLIRYRINKSGKSLKSILK